MLNGHPVIDADSHIHDYHLDWPSLLPPSLRDVAPRTYYEPTGFPHIDVEGRLLPGGEHDMKARARETDPRSALLGAAPQRGVRGGAPPARHGRDGHRHLCPVRRPLLPRRIEGRVVRRRQRHAPCLQRVPRRVLRHRAQPAQGRRNDRHAISSRRGGGARARRTAISGSSVPFSRPTTPTGPRSTTPRSTRSGRRRSGSTCPSASTPSERRYRRSSRCCPVSLWGTPTGASRACWPWDT